MCFYLFKLDTLAEKFNLSIHPPKVVKRSALVLPSKIAREIPPLAGDSRKALTSQLRLVVIPLRKLATSNSELPYLSGLQKIERFVNDCDFNSGQRESAWNKIELWRRREVRANRGAHAIDSRFC